MRANTNRFYLSTVSVVWAANLFFAEAGEQRSIEFGGNTLRRLLHKPAELFQEYWPYVAGGVVVLLLLRAYLRK